MVGSVASRLIVTDVDVEPPPLVALQLKTIPVVSAATVTGPQSTWDEISESGSATAQVSFASVVYQPLALSVPTMTGVMVGGVVSTEMDPPLEIVLVTPLLVTVTPSPARLSTNS